LAARRLRRRNGGADFRRARAFVLRVKQRFEPPYASALEQQHHHSAQGIPAAAAGAGGSRRRARGEEGRQPQPQQQQPQSSVYRAFLGVLRDFVADEAAALATADASESEVEAAEAEAAWACLSRRVLERVLELFEGHPDLVQGFCYFLPECLRVSVVLHPCVCVWLGRNHQHGG
jgi:hypothetical protein